MAERARSSGSPASPAPAISSPGRREDVLRTLRSAAGPRGIASLAADLQLHPNTVRFHLDSLIAAGRVRQADRGPRRPGRPALLYEAVRGMDPGGPRGYQTLAEILTVGLADLPDADALAVDAGRRWGRRRAARNLCATGDTCETDDADEADDSVLDRLFALLDDLGFAPDRRKHCAGTHEIGLRHCPFLEIAESHPHVVCPIHLGLMQGAMEEWGARQIVTELEPFVEPDLCVAHLSPID